MFPDAKLEMLLLEIEELDLADLRRFSIETLVAVRVNCNRNCCEIE